MIDFAVPAAPPLPLVIRPATDDDMPYIRGKFAEGYKHASNALGKMPWPAYKRDVRPRLYAALDDAEVIVADLHGAVAGWLAISRGRRVDAVHWMATRLRVGADGELLQRRGVMRQLVAAAGLRDRVVYTHRGPKRSDEWIAKWLLRRGAVSVIYEPYESWKI